MQRQRQRHRHRHHHQQQQQQLMAKSAVGRWNNRTTVRERGEEEWQQCEQE